MANRGSGAIGGFIKNRKSKDEFYEDEFGKSTKGKKKTQKRVEFHRNNDNKDESENDTSN